LKQELYQDQVHDFKRLGERWETEHMKFEAMTQGCEDLERRVLELYMRKNSTA